MVIPTIVILSDVRREPNKSKEPVADGSIEDVEDFLGNFVRSRSKPKTEERRLRTEN
jgi:hypothetical protein